MIPTVNVTVTVTDPSDTPVEGAAVTAKLNTRDIYQGQVVPRDEVTGETDADGECVLALFPNALGEVTGDFCGDGSTRHTSYKFTVRHPTTGKKLYQTVATVPNQNVDLTDIANNICSNTTSSATIDDTIVFADREVPAGTIDGSNQDFTLQNAPDPEESLQLYVNGVLYRNGVDYVLAGSDIEYVLGRQPQVGDSHYAWYRY